MKEYFVHIHEELGPLSIEELKKLKITRKTMTWYEGLEEWKHADEIPELQSMFPPKILSASIEDSPQINPNNNINVEPGSLLSSKNEKKNNNFFKIVILGIVIIVLSFIIYSDIQHTKLKAIHKLKIKEEDEKQKQLELEKKIQEEKKAAIDSQLKPEEIIEILGFKNKTIATLTKEERERYNFYLIVGQFDKGAPFDLSKDTDKNFIRKKYRTHNKISSDYYNERSQWGDNSIKVHDK